jgi:radical SAM superfamily enzyme YgiQ (UPF0313 family)
MNVLFLNPPSLKNEIFMKEIGRCGRKSVAGELWPQTGLAYLAAITIQSGHKAKIIDAMATQISLNNLIEVIQKEKFDLIIVHSSTPTFNNDIKIISEIKKITNSLIGFTGTHTTVLPEESLRQSEADFILVGEAESTLKELLDILNNYQFGKNDSSKSQHFTDSLIDKLKLINGLAIKLNNEVIITPPREIYPDLDSFPFPVRELLPNAKYTMPFFDRKPFVTIIPSRGCPFKCTFCRAGKVWGVKPRFRTPSNIVAEIKDVIYKLNIRNIVFMTDALTLKRDWTIALLNEILKENLSFRWICNSRVDTVDKEMLNLMKKAGCELISYGVESGDQSILDKAKKNIKLEDSIKAMELTRQAGILSLAYFIIGLPGETEETIKKTIRFAKKINPDYVNFHIATPFPGTEFYDYAKNNNLLISNNWDDYEEEGSAVIRTETMTPEQLVKYQKYAMNSFYLRPKYILKELLSIKSLSDLLAKIRAGINVIKKNISI